MKDHHVTGHKGYFGKSDCSAEAFLDLLEDRLSVSELNFAGSVKKNIPIYAASDIEPILASDQRQALMAEWAYVFSQRSGIVVIKGALSDMETIDQITDLFNTIIEEERLESSGGDHFGERGANDRIWNSLQKLCLRDPKLFARYFASPAIAAVSEAWLGPWSQMTTQVNLVRPGGKPQVCHRDYHLGFMTLEQAERFPYAHLFSGGLTWARLPIVMSLSAAPQNCCPIHNALRRAISRRNCQNLEILKSVLYNCPSKKVTLSFSTQRSFMRRGKTVLQIFIVWSTYCKSPPPWDAHWSK